MVLSLKLVFDSDEAVVTFDAAEDISLKTLTDKSIDLCPR
jgi:hypothetical protein